MARGAGRSGGGSRRGVVALLAALAIGGCRGRSDRPAGARPGAPPTGDEAAAAERPGPAAAPAPPPPAATPEPAATAPAGPLACYRLALNQTTLGPDDAARLCGASDAPGPVACYVRAQDETRLARDESIALCACAPSARMHRPRRFPAFRR